MSSHVEFFGLDKIAKKLQRIADIRDSALETLGEQLEDIITEDNRKGVLAGIDKDDKPMDPVTYRNGKAKKTAARKPSLFGKTIHPLQGHGPLAQGLHGNLTTAQYQSLTGPPLAPRRDSSRVITNFGALPMEISDGRLVVTMGWADVVSSNGTPFLGAHFKGAATGRGHRTKLPVRNLAGVRAWGREQAKRAARRWATDLMRGL